MLIRFFKHSFLTQYVALFLVQLALWFPSFMEITVMPDPSGENPFYQLIFNIFSGAKLLPVIIGFVLVYFEAVLLNFILAHHGLVPKNTLIPAFLFILFTGVFKETHTLHPFALITLIIILLLNLGFSFYEEQKQTRKNLFLSGFLIGIATMFFSYAFYLLIILYLAFVLMRIYEWRQWVIPIVGLFVPFLFTGVYYFLVNEFTFFLHSIVLNGLDLQLAHFDIGIQMYGFLSLVLLIFILSGFNLLVKLSAKNIDIRKKSDLVFYYLLLFILLLIFCPSGYFSIAFLFIPLSILVSIRISEKQKSFFYTIMIWLIFAVAIFMNYELMWWQGE